MSPFCLNARQPPCGLVELLGLFVKTPLRCGYWPVSSAERDTQHSESATNEFVNDAPWLFIRMPLAIVASSSVEKSSMRISTMLGFFGVSAARATGPAVVPETAGSPPVASPTASAAVSAHAGSRRRVRSGMWSPEVERSLLSADHDARVFTVRPANGEGRGPGRAPGRSRAR